MPLEEAEIIRQWYDVAEKCPDPWFRFGARWISFNAFYSARYPGLRDGERIGCVGDDIGLQILYLSQLDLNPVQEGIEFFRQRDGVEDMRNPPNRKRISDPERWGEVIECLYQVRNNLFHGNKSPTDSADLDVVQNADKVLREVLSLIVMPDIGENAAIAPD